MSLNAQRFLSVVVTYGITRIVYWLTHFHPTTDLDFLPGLAIDVLFWIACYLGMVWLLGKLIPTPKHSK